MLPAVSCSVYFHEIPTYTRRVHWRNHRLPTPQLAPAPPSQNTYARTYRPITNLPSHDRPPSTITSYILEIDRSSSDGEVTKRCSRHRNRGGRDDGRDHL